MFFGTGTGTGVGAGTAPGAVPAPAPAPGVGEGWEENCTQRWEAALHLPFPDWGASFRLPKSLFGSAKPWALPPSSVQSAITSRPVG
jgi:hypothetical protein